MITPQEREALAARLHQRRAATLEAMASFEDSTRPVELDQSTQGRLSRMDAIGQQQMALAGRAHLATELTRIDAALDRLARGQFGRCGRCQTQIEAERLKVDPALPLCLDCLEEIQEERRRDEHLQRNR